MLCPPCVLWLLLVGWNTLYLPYTGASVSLPIEPKKYMKLLVEQAMLQFFVAVKVRESKQLFLKVRATATI